MKIVIIISAMLFMSGCAKIASNYIPDELITQGATSEKNYITKEGMIDLSKLDIKKGDVDGRNEFIAKAISLSDKKCTNHKALIISNSNAWNVGTGTTAILFAGAASVVSHAKTAADLAAGAAAVTGIQALTNKELYGDMMGTTILRAIDVGREKKKAVILNGMSDAKYTLPTALIDLQAYHDSCSLMTGLVEVTKALDNRLPSKNELALDIKTLKAERDDLNKNWTGSDALKKPTLDQYENRIQEKTLLMATVKE